MTRKDDTSGIEVDGNPVVPSAGETDTGMKRVALRAHFDGEQIRLDEPFDLEPDTPLTVVVGGAEADSDLNDWPLLSSRGLATAYGDREPEYPLRLIKEPNPDYEGG
ncbi:MAG TPA: hypothetical protein VGH73_08085 [Thermoanaerobaculia bacterium]